MEYDQDSGADSEREIESRLITLSNEYRAKNNRGPLTADDRLAAAARKQAQRCKDAGRLDHNLGGSLGARVKGEGYRFAVVGENLAKRFPPAENILKGWINSSGHRANLLGPRHTQTGVGVVKAGRFTYACAIYAKPLRTGLEDNEEMRETSSLFLDQDPEESPPADSEE